MSTISSPSGPIEILEYKNPERQRSSEELFVLLHASATGPQSLNKLAARLANDHNQIVAPAFAGYGATDVNEDGKGRLATNRSIVQQTLLQYPAQRRILFGHSMGGLLALLTAIDEAHRGAPLDAVILYEPILVDLLDNCRTDHADARSWDQAILQELAAYVASGEPESGVRIFVESWNETSWHALPEAARTHLVAHASNLQLETAAVSGAQIKRSDMRKLKTPVLLLRGRLSPPITALIHETALAELPSSREAILTDCGHMGPLLNHQLVAESIAQFLHSPSSCMP